MSATLTNATPTKYERLDSLILNKIGGHPQGFMSIFVRDVREECERIAKEEGGSAEPFRVADRRLQALRRAGKIRFGRCTRDGRAHAGWVLVRGIERGDA